MKIGVVIQGLVDDLFILEKTVNNLKKFFDPNDIVISTWSTDNKKKNDIQSLCSDDDNNLFGIKTIRSDLDIFKKYKETFLVINGNNIIYQCYTSVAGIRHLVENGCTHAIKIRTDEYYKNFEPLITEISNDNRLHSGSLFFRKDFPYHIGDHVVAGPITEMYTLFNNCLLYGHNIINTAQGSLFEQEVINKKWSSRIFTDIDSDFVRLVNLTHTDVCPEVKITCEYISDKERRQIYAHEHVELTNKYFKVFDIRKFDEFYFSANSILDGTTITNKDLDEEGNIQTKKPKCLEHPDWLICDVCNRWALVELLLKSEARSNDDLVTLDNDYEKYCSIYNPALIAESTTERTHLQNFMVRR